jgi:hypothetical protein
MGDAKIFSNFFLIFFFLVSLRMAFFTMSQELILFSYSCIDHTMTINSNFIKISACKQN